jgi:16S rRNA (cytosine967-C5)-methyltransferase
MKHTVSVRQLALDCLLELEADNVPITSVIDRMIRDKNPIAADRRLLNELVYGTIRWRKQLDWVLNHFVNEGFRLNPRTRDILRLGTYQLLHLDRIPPHAAIYETVELAKPKSKTVRFINAVLRSVQRDAGTLEYPSMEQHPVQHIAVTQSYPLWLVERWVERHGVEWTLAFCRASNRVAPLSLRVNTSKTNRADLIESLTASGIIVNEEYTAPEGVSLSNVPPLQSLQAYKDGWFYVQDESAMLVTHLLQPGPSDTVIDFCAAPGGKTTHIAQLMDKNGKICAVDLSEEKIQRITENCQRLGFTNVQTQVLTEGKRIAPPASADSVLVDVPCSGFGTFRRHPDIRWKKYPEQIPQLAQLQLQLLKEAAQYVKPDGVLVYSTCSTEPEENEEVIRQFLKSHPQFSLESAYDFLPFASASAITPEGFLQTFPHKHRIDGAFAARLRAT